jgi:hypothetical protein
MNCQQQVLWSPATYASHTMQQLAKKRIPSFWRLWIQHLFQYSHFFIPKGKSRRYAAKPAYPTVTCKAELHHRANIILAQPSVLEPCCKNGIDALVRLLLLLLQTLHCTASCTLGSVHPPPWSSCGRRGRDETHKGRGGSSSPSGQDPRSILGKTMAKQVYSDALHSYASPNSCRYLSGSWPAWKCWASSEDETHHQVSKLSRCFELVQFFSLYLPVVPSSLELLPGPSWHLGSGGSDCHPQLKAHRRQLPSHPAPRCPRQGRCLCHHPQHHSRSWNWTIDCWRCWGWGHHHRWSSASSERSRHPWSCPNRGWAWGSRSRCCLRLARRHQHPLGPRHLTLHLRACGGAEGAAKRGSANRHSTPCLILEPLAEPVP